MIRTYLTISFRRLRRHPGYTFLNVFGLAVGITCFLLIALFVQDELRYDRFHTKADRIYRVTEHVTSMLSTSSEDLGETEMAWSPMPIGPALQQAYPEVERAVRVGDGFNSIVVQHGDEQFYEKGYLYTEPGFFDVFDFPLLRGNPETGLARPYTMMLSEDMAARYFGTADPIGQTLIVDGKRAYEVTGIFRNVRHDSHLQFDFLLSLESRFADGRARDDWNRFAYTYLLLSDAHGAETLAQRLLQFAEQHPARQVSSYDLMPMTDLHLYAHRRLLTGDFQPQGDIRYVYLLSAIALMVLLVACVNYMNLATARSAQRAREVGIRKVVGARRAQLVRQLMGESILFSTMAAGIAVGLAQLLLPFFDTLMDRRLELDLLGNAYLWGFLLAVVLFVGFVSGSYPALFLSRFRPALVLKGLPKARAWSRLRKSLVVFQLAVSVSLILTTLVVERQLRYVQAKSLGFNDEQVVTITARGMKPELYASFKQTLLKRSHVQQVTVSSGGPSKIYGIYSLDAQKVEDYAGDGTKAVTYVFNVDDDFDDVLQLHLAAGRMLSSENGTDAGEAIVVNEAAVRTFGWRSPDQALGKTIDFGSESSPDVRHIVGVLKDFHFLSLKSKIDPLALFLSPRDAAYVSARIAPDDVPGTLAFIEQTWHTFVPSHPFDYTFLDAQFDAMYRSEERFGRLFGTFATLTILIACLGLLGLAAYAAEQRTKEIGVRKVLGASVTGVVSLLTRDFVLLVAIAFVLSAPVAYFASKQWLDNFAYRIDVGWGLFAAAAAIALGVTVLTVSFQAVKAAVADPVKALRYE